ncbi:hypothetical protein HCH_03908 [Hahella chejuensis KCTC 2396]|uniref:Uncharacterized protein n=1 Tax=Hahella chejuensis (strain KCTC 2396) TaxID=349521 RepID=Q2SFE4_HAHCH|nr:hypothetical protein [Hahella chejuensis]ABC30630.1 hypothetical protein HCH_03908 [Hahella chejuensis KCTC 2396]
MKGLISVFEIENQPAKFSSLIKRLIDESKSSYILRPNGVKLVESLKQIKDDILYWPNWRSRPWVVAGRYEGNLSEVVYSGPFIKDCKGDNFNLQVASLLKHFDWAVFSYFTTYQSDFGCLVTSYPDLIEKVLVKAYGKDIEISVYEGDPIDSLRTATFYDYDVEGYFAYEVAKANGEDPPFLLCRIDLTNQELYRIWNSEIEADEEDPWYKNHLDKLTLVKEFTTGGVGFQYNNLIYQVSNEKAYLDIWSEASEDHSIAEATFSANADLSKLEAYMAGSYIFEVTKYIDDWCDWSYSQVYGGGADEHHAIFRSKDPRITSRLWELLGEDQISRF